MPTWSRPVWIRLMRTPTFKSNVRVLLRKHSWAKYLEQALRSPLAQTLASTRLSSLTWPTQSLWARPCWGSTVQISDWVKGFGSVHERVPTLFSRIASTAQINQPLWIRPLFKDRPLQTKRRSAKAYPRTITTMPCSDRWTLVVDLYPRLRMRLHSEVISRARCSIRRLLQELRKHMVLGEGLLQHKLPVKTICPAHLHRIVPHTVMIFIQI